MRRTKVTSSNVVSVGYDQQNMRLHVEFKGGSIYEYEGVPFGEAARLTTAPSVGSYFAAHIKDKYPTKKLEGGQ